MFYERSYVFVRQMFHHSNSIDRGLISPFGIGPLYVHDSINDITNWHVWGHTFYVCSVKLVLDMIDRDNSIIFYSVFAYKKHVVSHKDKTVSIAKSNVCLKLVMISGFHTGWSCFGA